MDEDVFVGEGKTNPIAISGDDPRYVGMAANVVASCMGPGKHQQNITRGPSGRDGPGGGGRF